jgi:hypothetical protein
MKTDHNGYAVNFRSSGISQAKAEELVPLSFLRRKKSKMTSEVAKI